MRVVEHVLHTFCQSFGFWEQTEEDTFRFLPEDKPLEISHRLSPPKPGWPSPDGLEFEGFIIGVEKDFHVSVMAFIKARPDFTLGELIDHILASGKQLSAS